MRVREAISHLRFGFGSAAGSSRPSSVARANDSARELVMRAYDDQGRPSPRSPPSRQRRTRLQLEPLSASPTVNHFPMPPPVDVGSRTSSPTLMGCNELRSASLPSLRSPNLASSSSVLRSPDAVLRQLSARMGKVRKTIDALLELLDDGTGKANVETLTTEIFALGAAANPPLSVSRQELGAALQLYVAPGTETVVLRAFARDLWSGQVRVKVKSPGKIASTSTLSDKASEPKGEEKQAAASMKRRKNMMRLAMRFGNNLGQAIEAGEEDSTDESPNQSAGHDKLAANKWWMQVGEDESQRAAAHLLETLKDAATESGHVSRAEFHKVLYSLGILRNFEEETNVLFGACDGCVPREPVPPLLCLSPPVARVTAIFSRVRPLLCRLARRRRRRHSSDGGASDGRRSGHQRPLSQQIPVPAAQGRHRARLVHPTVAR